MSDDLTDYEYLREHPAEFVDAIIGIEPTEYQREFLESDGTNKAFVSGRQVGKSRTAAWLALHYAVTNPGSLVLVTADAMRQSSELFAQLRSEMTIAGITDDQWGVSRDTQTTVEFEHNSRIKVVPTGRNGNKIRGYTADFIIVDEAAFVDDAIFEDVIEPMTFVSGGSIVLCSTPYGTSGYFYKKATKWATDGKNYSTWSPDTNAGISSYDNPHADREKLDEFKEGKTREQISREIEGRFVEGGNNYFPLELIRESMQDGVSKQSDNIYLGVDPSGSGDAESVMAFADEYGNVFKYESHSGSTIQFRKRIQLLHQNYDFEKILVDRGGVGENFVEELSDRIDGGRGNVVEQVFLTTQRKENIYSTLKARMETNLLSDDNRDDAPQAVLQYNADLKAQMENLGYTKTKNGTISIQPKENLNDDYPDAVALSIWALPDNASTQKRGARGMTEPVTIGRVVDVGDKQAYRFGEDRQEEKESFNRTTVTSSQL